MSLCARVRSHLRTEHTLYVHMNLRIHTYVHTHTHTYIRTYVRAYTCIPPHGAHCGLCVHVVVSTARASGGSAGGTASITDTQSSVCCCITSLHTACEQQKWQRKHTNFIPVLLHTSACIPASLSHGCVVPRCQGGPQRMQSGHPSPHPLQP